MTTRAALRTVPGIKQELMVAKEDFSVPRLGPLRPRVLVLGAHVRGPMCFAANSLHLKPSSEAHGWVTEATLPAQTRCLPACQVLSQAESLGSAVRKPGSLAFGQTDIEYNSHSRAAFGIRLRLELYL